MRWDDRLVWAWCAVATAFAIGGCGARERGGATPDAGAGDGAIVMPPRVRPDDELVLDLRRAGGVDLARWVVYCFDAVDILRSDGSILALGPGAAWLDIAPSDTSIAIAAEPGDCALGGVIGLAEGTTRADVALVGDDGTRISAPVQVVVHPGDVELVFTSVTVPVGGQSAYSLGARLPAGAGEGGGHLVWRWMSVAARDPGIATIAGVAGRERPWELDVRGISVGSTRTVVTYGPATETRTFMADADDITVLPEGTFGRVLSIAIRPGGSTCSAAFEGASCSMAPGECAPLEVTGLFYFEGTGMTYSTGIADRADITVTGGAAHVDRSGPSPALCADTRGDAIVSACLEGICAWAGFAVFAPSDAPTLTAEPTTVAATGTRDASRDDLVTYCLDFAAELEYADGSTRDVATSPVLEWVALGAPPFFAMSERVLGADGLPAPGAPCFVGGLERVDLTIESGDVDVRYGGVPARIHIDVTIPPRSR